MNTKLYAALAAAVITASGTVLLAAPASADVYYKNCAEARAAGAAPLYRGEPGYRPALDRDNDGIACEPRRGDRSDDRSGDKNESTTRKTREAEEPRSTHGSSGKRSYGQIGDDDVPVGGVAAGGG